MVYRRASSELSHPVLCYRGQKHFVLLSLKFFGLLFCAHVLNSVLVLEGDDGNWSIAIVKLLCIGSSPVVLCNEKSHHCLFNNVNAVRGEHVSYRVH